MRLVVNAGLGRTYISLIHLD